MRPSDAVAGGSRQVGRRRSLQLVVAAVFRPLVRTPAHELRAVAEAVSLHVVVGNLDDALGPERLPAQVLAAVPAAGGAREALHLLVGLLLRRRPVAPRVALEGVVAQRPPLLGDLPAN